MPIRSNPPYPPRSVNRSDLAPAQQQCNPLWQPEPQPGSRCLAAIGTLLAASCAATLSACGASGSHPSAAVEHRPPEVAQVIMVAPPPVATIAAPPEASTPVVVSATPGSSSEFDVDGVEVVGRGQHSTPRAHEIPPPARLRSRWATQVGRTTFRTTMVKVGDTIVIGTHGQTLNGKNEKSDGIYILDAKTGAVRSTIHTPGAGDLDVGGIAVDGGKVYFGTDNSQVIAATLEGRVLWTARAKGKVRPAPALGDLDGDKQIDVVVGDESGELMAIDGKNGSRIWTVVTGGNSNNAKGFIGAAAIRDLDGDGLDDVIAGARDGVLAAYRGKDGKVLWQAGSDSGIHASPSLVDFDQDGKPEVLAAWSYCDVAILDGATGRKRWSAELSLDSAGIEGLFGSPIPLAGSPGVLIVPTAWWGKDDGVVGHGPLARDFKTFEGRVSSTAVVTDLNGDGVREAILGTEKGLLIALQPDGGYGKLATLGGPIEASAMIVDTDGDGTYELLVASNDGKLTCFETGSRARPDLSRFRGDDPRNRGDLGAVRMGWRVKGAGGTHTPSKAPTSPGSTIRIDYLTCCSALQDEATRAPSPRNAQLLQSAGMCNMMASQGVERKQALDAVRRSMQGRGGVPRACR
jgi:outer membrane protein assembly factor BamB